MNLAKSRDYFDPSKINGRIHIIGCGSVGSTIAENLIRMGATKFTLWDFDIVEPHNIVNQMFRFVDIGKTKVDALKDILVEINPDAEATIDVMPHGWEGQQLNGYVFLCVDNIDIRRAIVEQNMMNFNIKAMFDFRTSLEDAQHYAADWRDRKMKENLLASMQFTHEEASSTEALSACGYVLGVAPTVRGICTLGAANFVNFLNGKGLKTLVLFNVFGFEIDAF